MKVCFKEIESTDESMRFIILVDDDNIEIKKFPIYINKEMTEKLPALLETYNDMPDIFRMIYESGLKQEKIEFIEEKLNL